METNCEDIVENIEHRETRRTGEHEETLTVCCSLRRIIKNIEHREPGRKRENTQCSLVFENDQCEDNE